MNFTTYSNNGSVVAPHHLASEAGIRVLKDGGNAVEAMISAAATIAVVYPHMNGLGGDNFWLIDAPGEDVVGVQACGGAASSAQASAFLDRNLTAIPQRGPMAALTVAGAVSGWSKAFEYSRTKLGGRLTLGRLLEDAIYYAEQGTVVTDTLAINAREKKDELLPVAGFAGVYAPDGRVVESGDIIRQTRVGSVLRRLAEAGLDDFYRGDLGKSIAADLEKSGSLLRRNDLEQFDATFVAPIYKDVSSHRVYNLPPPTQGLASLLIISAYARMQADAADGFDYIHRLVEITKGAFTVRDNHITDPASMSVPVDSLLEDRVVDRIVGAVDVNTASTWPREPVPGDTVWLGAIDREGRAVSFIQSIFFEFGSGLVLDETGITWQNRGSAFVLDPGHIRSVEPGKLPFHTIQPALARMSDGRVMPYGTMGGDGQPQTQAMIFSRHILHGHALQATVTSPRWLLGKTWGSDKTNLRIENRFDLSVIESLMHAGHDIEVVGAFEEIMGHAGALIRHPDGLIEAACDPRSDGSVAAF